MRRKHCEIGALFFRTALFFTMMSGQQVLAGNNNNNNPTNNELIIYEVSVTLGNPDTLTIRGENFDNGASPSVTLGEQGELTVLSVTGTEIVAECPTGACVDGDYMLAVTTGPAVIAGFKCLRLPVRWLPCWLIQKNYASGW